MALRQRLRHSAARAAPGANPCLTAISALLHAMAGLNPALRHHGGFGRAEALPYEIGTPALRHPGSALGTTTQPVDLPHHQEN